MADQLDNSVVPRSMRRRDYGGFREPASVAPAVPVTQPTRSFGFESGAGPGEKLAAARAPELAGAGAALGEPTSFRGGVGAPMPVEVVRGGRTTYTNPAPDAPGGGYNPTAARNTQEFASPLQAQQAWNRGMRSEAVAEGDRRGFTVPEATLDARYGGFRTPGTSLAETVGEQHRLTGAAENKRPDLVAAADIAGQKQKEVVRAKVGTDYDTLMHESPYSTFDTKSGKTAFKAKDESQYRDYLASRNLALAQGDPAVGRQHFEERQQVRQWLQTQSLAPNTNIDAMLDAASRSPEHWQGLVADAQKVIKTTQPTPKVSSWFGPTQLQGEAGAPPPAAPAPPPIRPTQPPAGFRGLVESME